MELLTVAIHKGLNKKTSFYTKYVYVREIWIGVREKSGKCQGILFCLACMNPESVIKEVVICIYLPFTFIICYII